jgi:hypothetical protein
MAQSVARQWPGLPTADPESLANWAKQITRLLQEGAIANGASLDGFLTPADGDAAYVNVTGDTMTGNLVINQTAAGNSSLRIIGGEPGVGNPNMEIGRIDGTVSLPHTDFHSGATPTDFDTRLIASGGTGSDGGGTFDIVSAALNAGPPGLTTAVQRAGKQTLFVPATAMYKATAAAGPSAAQFAAGSSVWGYLAFDPTNLEDAHFSVGMPKSWNLGTISFKAYWFHPATVTNFGVHWQLYSVAYQNAQLMDGIPFTTPAAIADTGGTTNTMYISDESSTANVGSTPGAMDCVDFLIRRNPTDASDTLAVDALLLGVMIFYTTNAPNDA